MAHMAGVRDNKPGPFYFQERHGSLDIRSLMRIDVEQLIYDVDIALLQQHLENVAFARVKPSDLQSYSDDNICKLIEVMQLMLEYMMHVQVTLQAHSIDLENECERLRGLITAYKSDRAKKKSAIEDAKKDMRKQKKIIRTYEAILLSRGGVVEPELQERIRKHLKVSRQVSARIFESVRGGGTLEPAEESKGEVEGAIGQISLSNVSAELFESQKRLARAEGHRESAIEQLAESQQKISGLEQRVDSLSTDLASARAEMAAAHVQRDAAIARAEALEKELERSKQQTQNSESRLQHQSDRLADIQEKFEQFKESIRLQLETQQLRNATSAPSEVHPKPQIDGMSQQRLPLGRYTGLFDDDDTGLPEYATVGVQTASPVAAASPKKLSPPVRLDRSTFQHAEQPPSPVNEFQLTYSWQPLPAKSHLWQAGIGYAVLDGSANVPSAWRGLLPAETDVHQSSELQGSGTVVRTLVRIPPKWTLQLRIPVPAQLDSTRYFSKEEFSVNVKVEASMTVADIYAAVKKQLQGQLPQIDRDCWCLVHPAPEVLRGVRVNDRIDSPNACAPNGVLHARASVSVAQLFMYRPLVRVATELSDEHVAMYVRKYVQDKGKLGLNVSRSTQLLLATGDDELSPNTFNRYDSELQENAVELCTQILHTHTQRVGEPVSPKMIEDVIAAVRSQLLQRDVPASSTWVVPHLQETELVQRQSFVQSTVGGSAYSELKFEHDGHSYRPHDLSSIPSDASDSHMPTAQATSAPQSLRSGHSAPGLPPKHAAAIPSQPKHPAEVKHAYAAQKVERHSQVKQSSKQPELQSTSLPPAASHHHRGADTVSAVTSEVESVFTFRDSLSDDGHELQPAVRKEEVQTATEIKVEQTTAAHESDEQAVGPSGAATAVADEPSPVSSPAPETADTRTAGMTSQVVGQTSEPSTAEATVAVSGGASATAEALTVAETGAEPATSSDVQQRRLQPRALSTISEGEEATDQYRASRSQDATTTNQSSLSNRSEKLSHQAQVASSVLASAAKQFYGQLFRGMHVQEASPPVALQSIPTDEQQLLEEAHSVTSHHTQSGSTGELSERQSDSGADSDEHRGAPLRKDYEPVTSQPRAASNIEQQTHESERAASPHDAHDESDGEEDGVDLESSIDVAKAADRYEARAAQQLEESEQKQSDESQRSSSSHSHTLEVQNVAHDRSTQRALAAEAMSVRHARSRAAAVHSSDSESDSEPNANMSAPQSSQPSDDSVIRQELQRHHQSAAAHANSQATSQQSFGNLSAVEREVRGDVSQPVPQSSSQSKNDDLLLSALDESEF